MNSFFSVSCTTRILCEGSCRTGGALKKSPLRKRSSSSCHYVFITSHSMLSKSVAPIIARVQRRDAKLADQMRRAAQSVHLNIAEAEGLSDGNQRTRFGTARGSARETIAALELAQASATWSTLPTRSTDSTTSEDFQSVMDLSPWSWTRSEDFQCVVDDSPRSWKCSGEAMSASEIKCSGEATSPKGAVTT